MRVRARRKSEGTSPFDEFSGVGVTAQLQVDKFHFAADALFCPEKCYLIP
jgi:hypothetical protein